MLSIAKETAALERLTTGQLRARYAEVFGESTHANNKAWLQKRIVWRLQANAEGGLSDRARQRAIELANDADLRVVAPKDMEAPPAILSIPVASKSDPRLPPAGTVLTRAYKGQTIRVTVLPHGFEHAGETFATLSAVAKAITGSHCNGYHFFRLNGGDR